MKKLQTSLLIIVFFVAGINDISAQKRNIFQLTFYTVKNEVQEQKLDEFLEYTYIPALHEMGIENVGVFKTIDGRNADQRFTVVFVPFDSFKEFEKTSFKIDDKINGKDVAVAIVGDPNEEPPYVRKNVTLMRAFSSKPEFLKPGFSNANKDRVYELRSYESATENLHQKKVEMFDSGESDIFVDLGFQPMFFGQVFAGAKMPNLMYMTCHTNEEAQTANWDKFRDDPRWKEMKDLPEYKNTVSHADKWMLFPTNYSDL